MDSAAAADPTTVLSAISTGVGTLQVRRNGPAGRMNEIMQLAMVCVVPIRPGPFLQVSSVPTSSEPTTPSSESPLALDASLREWLTEALVANSTNPKVYTKLLVSNAAAGSIIGKVCTKRAWRVTIMARWLQHGARSVSAPVPTARANAPSCCSNCMLHAHS